MQILPVSWVVLALLGGAMRVNDAGSLSNVLLFVLAGMLCLLVHEFGHALVGRWAGAEVAGVEIAGMGGTTSYVTLPPHRSGYFLMTLAGPLASLLLGAVLGVCFGMQLGNVWAGVRYAFLMPWQDTLPLELQQQLVLGIYQYELSPMLLQAYSTGILICFWWSLFNLLPLFPLDGGRLLGSVLNNYLVPCVLGLVGSAALAFWALLAGQWFNVMILGYLAYINWQYFRVLRSRKTQSRP